MTTTELADRSVSKAGKRSEFLVAREQETAMPDEEMAKISKEDQLGRPFDFQKVFQLKDYYDYPNLFDWWEIEWVGVY